VLNVRYGGDRPGGTRPGPPAVPTLPRRDDRVEVATATTTIAGARSMSGASSRPWGPSTAAGPMSAAPTRPAARTRA